MNALIPPYTYVPPFLRAAAPMANGGPQGLDPGPPWRLFFLVITVAPYWITQRPLGSLVSSSFLAISNMPLLSGGKLIGGGGNHVQNTTPNYTFGPESLTCASQLDFMDAIPIFGLCVGRRRLDRVSRDLAKTSVMFKDLVSPAGHNDSATQLSHSVYPTNAAP